MTQDCHPVPQAHWIALMYVCRMSHDGMGTGNKNKETKWVTRCDRGEATATGGPPGAGGGKRAALTLKPPLSPDVHR